MKKSIKATIFFIIELIIAIALTGCIPFVLFATYISIWIIMPFSGSISCVLVCLCFILLYSFTIISAVFFNKLRRDKELDSRELAKKEIIITVALPIIQIASLIIGYLFFIGYFHF